MNIYKINANDQNFNGLLRQQQKTTGKDTAAVYIC